MHDESVTKKAKRGWPRPTATFRIETTIMNRMPNAFVNDEITTIISQTDERQEQGLEARLQPWWPGPSMHDESVIKRTKRGWPRPTATFRIEPTIMNAQEVKGQEKQLSA
jgi:hypothetical protein